MRSFNSNPAYVRLLQNWRELTDKQTRAELVFERELAKLGLRYRFQDLKWRYIIDFTLPDQKIAIEIDGASHNSKEAKEKDEKRDAWLRGIGWKICRFTNEEVQESASGCVGRLLPYLPRRDEARTCSLSLS